MSVHSKVADSQGPWRPVPDSFVEPPWRAPLDPAVVIRAIPENASIAGMFLTPMVEVLRASGAAVELKRERYTPFHFYPLREHAELLVECCVKLYAGKPLRQALRKLGRAAPNALLSSTLGRVTLGSAQGPTEVLQSLAKTYALNLRPSGAVVLEASPGRVIVRLSSIYHFIDCHHVGVFEGALRHAGVRGDVAICSYSSHEADLLCTW